MADTAIEWASKVWNPIVGCSLQSPGCTNCYAMRMAWRLQAMAPRPDGTGNYGLHHYVGTVQQSKGGPVWTGQVNIAPDDVFMAPLRRKKPTDYFVNSMSDLFHPSVPFEVVDRVFAVMALAHQHTFKILTKHSDRMRQYFEILRDRGGMSDTMAIVWEVAQDIAVEHGMLDRYQPTVRVLPNVWLGVSAEDQQRWDERVEDLENTPAAVRFVSIEPLLGPIKMNLISRTLMDCLAPMTPDVVKAIHDQVQRPFEIRSMTVHSVDWIIVGGESGPGARPMHPDWVRNIRAECKLARTPLFFKQWGEYASVSEVEGSGKHYQFPDGSTVRKVGKKLAGRLLDGVEHNGMPEVRA